MTVSGWDGMGVAIPGPMEPRTNHTMRTIGIVGAVVLLTVIGGRILLQRNNAASEGSSAQERAATATPVSEPVAVVQKNGQAPVGPAPLDGCYTVTFKHKEISGHGDREACSAHKNSLVLAGDEVLAALPRKLSGKALCVRVDGVPVKYEQAKDTLVFGAVAGPQSVISVQACLGKADCKLNCVVPKDEFMDAIGAAEEEAGRAVASAKWDPNDKEEDHDASADVDEDLKNHGLAERKSPLFRDWLVVGHSPRCETAKEGS